MIKVTSSIVIDEFKRRGIQVEVVTETPYVLLRYFFEDTWHLLRSTMPETTSAVGYAICENKVMSHVIAEVNNIPVPDTIVYTGPEDAENFLQRYGDIVVKPADAAHGNGITIGVTTAEALRSAVELAAKTSKKGTVLLQQRVTGSDLRILIIGGRYAATARRIPASVIGDGKRTIRELIAQENTTHPERGWNYEKRLNFISLEASERFLGEKLDIIVPAKDQEVTVVGTANIGSGGIAADYTDSIPDDIKNAAETFARTVKVVACGVDFIWDEQTNDFYFIESNSCPSLGLHAKPSEGISRPVVKQFVDTLLGVIPPVWGMPKYLLTTPSQQPGASRRCWL